MKKKTPNKETLYKTASTVEELMPEEDAQPMVNVVNNAISLITLLRYAKLKRLMLKRQLTILVVLSKKMSFFV